MTQYQVEQLENIRRAAESGRRTSLEGANESAIDSFQHIIDLVETITLYKHLTGDLI